MIEVIGSMNELDATQWDALTDGSPLLSYAFLSALEDSGCVGDGTGWQAYPLLAREDGMLVGAIPLFVKGHSYGEYVFDWSWADAYETVFRTTPNCSPPCLSPPSPAPDC